MSLERKTALDIQAQQIHELSRRILSEIDENKLAENFEAQIKRPAEFFNYVQDKIINLILQNSDNPQTATKSLRDAAELAKKLREMGDFYSYTAVMGALNSKELERFLPFADAQTKQVFADAKIFTNPQEVYKVYSANEETDFDVANAEELKKTDSKVFQEKQAFRDQQIELFQEMQLLRERGIPVIPPINAIAVSATKSRDGAKATEGKSADQAKKDAILKASDKFLKAVEAIRTTTQSTDQPSPETESFEQYYAKQTSTTNDQYISDIQILMQSLYSEDKQEQANAVSQIDVYLLEIMQPFLQDVDKNTMDRFLERMGAEDVSDILARLPEQSKQLQTLTSEFGSQGPKQFQFILQMITQIAAIKDYTAYDKAKQLQYERLSKNKETKATAKQESIPLARKQMLDAIPDRIKSLKSNIAEQKKLPMARMISAINTSVKVSPEKVFKPLQDNVKAQLEKISQYKVKLGSKKADKLNEKRNELLSLVFNETFTNRPTAQKIAMVKRLMEHKDLNTHHRSVGGLVKGRKGEKTTSVKLLSEYLASLEKLHESEKLHPQTQGNTRTYDSTAQASSVSTAQREPPAPEIQVGNEDLKFNSGDEEVAPREPIQLGNEGDQVEEPAPVVAEPVQREPGQLGNEGDQVEEPVPDELRNTDDLPAPDSLDSTAAVTATTVSAQFPPVTDDEPGDSKGIVLDQDQEEEPAPPVVAEPLQREPGQIGNVDDQEELDEQRDLNAGEPVIPPVSLDSTATATVSTGPAQRRPPPEDLPPPLPLNADEKDPTAQTAMTQLDYAVKEFFDVQEKFHGHMANFVALISDVSKMFTEEERRQLMGFLQPFQELSSNPYPNTGTIEDIAAVIRSGNEGFSKAWKAYNQGTYQQKAFYDFVNSLMERYPTLKQEFMSKNSFGLPLTDYPSAPMQYAQRFKILAEAIAKQAPEHDGIKRTIEFLAEKNIELNVGYGAYEDEEAIKDHMKKLANRGGKINLERVAALKEFFIEINKPETDTVSKIAKIDQLLLDPRLNTHHKTPIGLIKSLSAEAITAVKLLNKYRDALIRLEKLENPELSEAKDVGAPPPVPSREGRGQLGNVGDDINLGTPLPVPPVVDELGVEDAKNLDVPLPVPPVVEANQLGNGDEKEPVAAPVSDSGQIGNIGVVDPGDIQEFELDSTQLGNTGPVTPPPIPPEPVDLKDVPPPEPQEEEVLPVPPVVEAKDIGVDSTSVNPQATSTATASAQTGNPPLDEAKQKQDEDGPLQAIRAEMQRLEGLKDATSKHRHRALKAVIDLNNQIAPKQKISDLLAGVIKDPASQPIFRRIDKVKDVGIVGILKAYKSAVDANITLTRENLAKAKPESPVVDSTVTTQRAAREDVKDPTVQAPPSPAQQHQTQLEKRKAEALELLESKLKTEQQGPYSVSAMEKSLRGAIELGISIRGVGMIMSYMNKTPEERRQFETRIDAARDFIPDEEKQKFNDAYFDFNVLELEGIVKHAEEIKQAEMQQEMNGDELQDEDDLQQREAAELGQELASMMSGSTTSSNDHDNSDDDLKTMFADLDQQIGQEEELGQLLTTNIDVPQSSNTDDLDLDDDLKELERLGQEVLTSASEITAALNGDGQDPAPLQQQTTDETAVLTSAEELKNKEAPFDGRKNLEDLSKDSQTVSKMQKLLDFMNGLPSFTAIARAVKTENLDEDAIKKFAKAGRTKRETIDAWRKRSSKGNGDQHPAAEQAHLFAQLFYKNSKGEISAEDFKRNLDEILKNLKAIKADGKPLTQMHHLRITARPEQTAPTHDEQTSSATIKRQ